MAATRSLVRDASFDALGHELVGGATALEIELVLEVPVAASAPHRANRAHPAIFLVAAALEQDQLAGALVGAGKQISDHRAVRADGERLDDVTGVANAAVGDDRDIAARGGTRALHDRADHRHANPGDDACRADRSRADAQP